LFGKTKQTKVAFLHEEVDRSLRLIGRRYFTGRFLDAASAELIDGPALVMSNEHLKHSF